MVRLFLIVLIVTSYSSFAHAQSQVSEEEFLSSFGIHTQGSWPCPNGSEWRGPSASEPVCCPIQWVASSARSHGAVPSRQHGGSRGSRLSTAVEEPQSAAKAGLQAANLELETSRLELRSELRRVFAEWALTSERTAIIDSHLGLIERLAEQGRARARSGEESGLSARRLSLAALEVRAEAARAAAAATHARAMALSWNRELTDLGAQALLPALPVLSDTVRTPLRSDLLARRFEVEQANWQLRQGRRFFEFPSWSSAGSGSANRTWNSRAQPSA